MKYKKVRKSIQAGKEERKQNHSDKVAVTEEKAYSVFITIDVKYGAE